MESTPYNIEEIKFLLSLTNPKKRKNPLQTDDSLSYLASSMCDWTEEQQSEALLSVYNKEISSPYYKLLVDIYQADKHIEYTQSHQAYIMKTFNRLKVYFPTVKEFQIKKHDQSKYSFKQVIGYTKRFIHSCSWEDEIWQDALQDHYHKEDHHPEHYKNKNMPRDYLEESVIDMIACHWERDLYGITNMDNYELANINKIFLNRYTVDDKKEVTDLLKNIQMDNNSN